MTLYIGVDIHARQQTLSYLDTSDGTTGQVELQHERDAVKGFYSKFQVSSRKKLLSSSKPVVTPTGSRS